MSTRQHGEAQTPPNICFHGIGTPGAAREPGEEQYWISRAGFLSILDELALWPGAAISFDDSNASDIEVGLDALRQRGLRATFFVIAERLNTPGSLSDADLRTLVGAGMGIGNHGMDHRPWRGLDRAGQDRELVAAREAIARAIGGPVRSAALPLGRYDRRLLARLRTLDYTHVYTSDRRIPRAGAWLQPRFSVRTGDTAATLREQVAASRALHRRLVLEATGLAKQLR